MKNYSTKFKCFDINWDTDGRGTCGLPNEMTIEFDNEYLESSVSNDDVLEEVLADELSDKTGFCVIDFKYEKL